LALLGGVHGDEDEGVLAAHRVINELRRHSFSGLVRVVAPANPIAWAAFSRTSPLDNCNLARCFPGDGQSNPTSLLASGITTKVIEGADILIDLHSAGLRYAMPLLCGYSRRTLAEDASRRAAEAFGAPIIWAHPGSVPGRSLSVAAERGIPAIYAECGGGGGIQSKDLDSFVDGVFNVMSEFNMLPKSFGRRREDRSQWVFGSGDLDDGALSGHHGLFAASVQVGATLTPGAEIGRIYDYQGEMIQKVQAPWAGTVMFLRRQARVLPEDVIFVLGRLDDDRA
jgi:predicted deacylase